MSRLHTEYQRLYLPPDARDAADAEHAPLLGRDGRVRAMVLGLRQPADWGTLCAVWRAVQTELEWPAPAIAVNGVDAFELWFSLAQPVPAAEAASVLQGLCRRHLPDVMPARLSLWPGPSPDLQPWTAPRIPALQAASGGWSAFVAPDLPAVFGDQPMLDFRPGDDAQAELLSRSVSVRPADWQAALDRHSHAAPGAASARPDPGATPPHAPVGPTPHTALNGPYQDPRAFLSDVMNEPTVPLELRIQAAKALLRTSA
jgi:hypothetical protein